MKVLLIEDELADILLFRRAVEQSHLNWTVQVLRDASSVLTNMAGLSKNRPDFILLDINLPGTSGLELLPRLRRNCPDTPILILSTSQSPHDLEAARAGGATNYYIKPLNYRTLVNTLREIDRFVLRRGSSESNKSTREFFATEEFINDRSA